MTSVPDDAGDGTGAEQGCRNCGRTYEAAGGSSLWLTPTGLLCEDCAPDFYPSTREFFEAAVPYTWFKALSTAVDWAVPYLKPIPCPFCRVYALAAFRVLADGGKLRRPAIVACIRPRLTLRTFYRRLSEHEAGADHPFIRHADLIQRFPSAKAVEPH